jgi:hypothetical protein
MNELLPPLFQIFWYSGNVVGIYLFLWFLYKRDGIIDGMVLYYRDWKKLYKEWQNRTITK